MCKYNFYRIVQSTSLSKYISQFLNLGCVKMIIFYSYNVFQMYQCKTNLCNQISYTRILNKKKILIDLIEFYKIYPGYIVKLILLIVGVFSNIKLLLKRKLKQFPLADYRRLMWCEPVGCISPGFRKLRGFSFSFLLLPFRKIYTYIHSYILNINLLPTVCNKIIHINK